ncbi:MAG: 4Fe-4S dicluster domain-containing protein [Clostridia bacterium]|nr:4Fe-4S dicluster domain-containing protein [Clostridia bacterium]
MFAVKLENLNDFLIKLNGILPVYAPINQNNIVDFKRLDNSNILDLDLKSVNTQKSPKNFFFSCYQDIVEFNVEGKNISIKEIEKDNNSFVVFGVKACDEKSFKILDSVFLSNPCDEFYQNKRNNGIIITLACNKFDNSCFCLNFDIEPFNPKGDIACFNTPNHLVFQGITEKGIAFLNKYSELFIIIDFDLEKFKQDLKEKFMRMPLANLDLNAFKNKPLLDIFNDEKWDTLSQTCLGCGSCTFFCPTCQCYDIRDFKNKNSITRYRCWDSCMYSDFTLVAGGGNPRKTQKERFRQRFMHKLVYSPTNTGEFGCVGCGRCLKVCPNSLNIVNVIKKLGE